MQIRNILSLTIIVSTFSCKEMDTNLLIEKHINGNLKLTVPIINGQKHGFQTEYFENGKPKLMIPYQNGVENGFVIGYDTLGNKSYFFQVSHGQIGGHVCTLYKNGSIKQHGYAWDEDRIGLFTEYDSITGRATCRFYKYNDMKLSSTCNSDTMKRIVPTYNLYLNDTLDFGIAKSFIIEIPNDPLILSSRYQLTSYPINLSFQSNTAKPLDKGLNIEIFTPQKRGMQLISGVIEIEMQDLKNDTILLGRLPIAQPVYVR